MAAFESAGRQLSAARELDLTKYYFYQRQAFPPAPRRRGEHDEGATSAVGRLARGERQNSSQDEEDISSSSAAPHHSNRSAGSPSGSWSSSTNHQNSSANLNSNCTPSSRLHAAHNQQARGPAVRGEPGLVCARSLGELAAARHQRAPQLLPSQLPAQLNSRRGEELRMISAERRRALEQRSLDLLAGAMGQPAGSRGGKPSIEEQLRRLLELEPAVAPGTIKTTAAANVGRASPISGPLQGQLLSQAQHRRPERRALIEPADRMMVFMLASKRAAALQEDSLAEKNKRVLRWLENCANSARTVH